MRTRNLFQTKQREITPKLRKPELSFLYATHRLVLFCISTKYHKNIPKGIKAGTKSMHNHCQIWQREITAKVKKKGRVVILVRDTWSRPFLNFYKYHQNIPKGIRVSERTRNVFQTKQREVTPNERKPDVVLSCSTFLPSLSPKYSKGYSSYRADKTFLRRRMRDPSQKQ